MTGSKVLCVATRSIVACELPIFSATDDALQFAPHTQNASSDAHILHGGLYQNSLTHYSFGLTATVFCTADPAGEVTVAGVFVDRVLNDPLVTSAVYDSVLRTLASDPKIALSVVGSAYKAMDAEAQRRFSPELGSARRAKIRSTCALTEQFQMEIPSMILFSWPTYTGATADLTPLQHLTAATVTIMLHGGSAKVPFQDVLRLQSVLRANASSTSAECIARAQQLFSMLLTALKIFAQQVSSSDAATSSARLWAADQVWGLQHTVEALLYDISSQLSSSSGAGGPGSSSKQQQSGSSKKSSKQQQKEAKPTTDSSSSRPTAEQQLWLLLLGRSLLVYCKAVHSCLGALAADASRSSGNGDSTAAPSPPAAAAPAAILTAAAAVAAPSAATEAESTPTMS